MERYGHIDVNYEIKYKFDFHLYDLEHDLKIKNPAWHPPTPFPTSYELSI